MCQNLVDEIKNIEKNQNAILEEDEMYLYTKAQDKLFMKQFKTKYITSALLKSRILYWSALFPGGNSMKIIKDAFGFK